MDKNKRFPSNVKCPYCKTELELENGEQESGKFTCPECKKVVTKVKDKSGLQPLDENKKLPSNVKCPYCKTELELEKEEQESGKFTCPECKKVATNLPMLTDTPVQKMRARKIVAVISVVIGGLGLVSFFSKSVAMGASGGVLIGQLLGGAAGLIFLYRNIAGKEAKR